MHDESDISTEDEIQFQERYARLRLAPPNPAMKAYNFPVEEFGGYTENARRAYESTLFRTLACFWPPQPSVDHSNFSGPPFFYLPSAQGDLRLRKIYFTQQGDQLRIEEEGENVSQGADEGLGCRAYYHYPGNDDHPNYRKFRATQIALAKFFGFYFNHLNIRVCLLRSTLDLLLPSHLVGHIGPELTVIPIIIGREERQYVQVTSFKREYYLSVETRSPQALEEAMAFLERSLFREGPVTEPLTFRRLISFPTPRWKMEQNSWPGLPAPRDFILFHDDRWPFKLVYEMDHRLVETMRSEPENWMVQGQPFIDPDTGAVNMGIDFGWVWREDLLPHPSQYTIQVCLSVPWSSRNANARYGTDLVCFSALTSEAAYMIYNYLGSLQDLPWPPPIFLGGDDPMGGIHSAPHLPTPPRRRKRRQREE